MELFTVHVEEIERFKQYCHFCSVELVEDEFAVIFDSEESGIGQDIYCSLKCFAKNNEKLITSYYN